MIESPATYSGVVRESFFRRPNVILTPELALRAHRVLSKLPDEFEIATLLASYDSVVNSIAKREGRNFEKPPEEWVEFIDSLNHQEDVQLRRVIRNEYRFHDVRTMGDMREFSNKPHPHHRVGPRGNAFLFLASQKQEPPPRPSWRSRLRMY